MSHLAELTEYKNTIINRITSNSDLCKAISSPLASFLESPVVEPEDLLYKNVFPYNYIPTDEESVSKQNTYITLSVTDYRQAGNQRFKAGNIYIYAFTHKDLIRTDYGYLRTDYMISEIDKMLNGKRGIGIGELEFVGMREYIVNKHLLGYCIQYRPVDFNK